MVKLYADGANIEQMVALADRVSGYTTNPSLMRKAGVKDYKAFAKQALAALPNKPISFEVFADDLPDMERQAREIASWGEQVYVKIPVTNTLGVDCGPLIRNLSRDEIKVNVTAVTTFVQVVNMCGWIWPHTPAILSIFAGRIADTGVDPIPVIKYGLATKYAKTEILWASTREVLNIKQAAECGCDIITVPPEILGKLALTGKNLTEYSLETVQMFHRDAKEAGYAL
jgi:transaldolase